MSAHQDNRISQTSPDASKDSLIDLRELRFSWFTSNTKTSPESESFLDLRTTRMRQYGWRDVPPGAHDHDSYDDLGDRNVSIVLSTGSGVLLAGTRITQPNLRFLENTSVKMWGSTPAAILEHQLLHELHADNRTVDNTRLLLSDDGRPEHILILLGAGFEATERRITPFFTITDSLHRFIQTVDLHMTIVHQGSIGGEGCVFGFFSPDRIFAESGAEAVHLLELGTKLAKKTPKIFAPDTETAGSDPLLQ